MTDETSTEPQPEGPSEADQQRIQMAVLQEQAEADQAELTRLRQRCVTLRAGVNSLAAEVAELKQQLTAKGAADKRKAHTAKNKKKGK